MKRKYWPLIAILLLLSPGCATAPAGPPTVDVTGAWEGEWVSSTYQGSNGQVSMTLQQTGANVTGEIRTTGMGQSIQVNGPIEGTVSDDVFSFRGSSASVGRFNLRRKR